MRVTSWPGSENARQWLLLVSVLYMHGTRPVRSVAECTLTTCNGQYWRNEICNLRGTKVLLCSIGSVLSDVGSSIIAVAGIDIAFLYLLWK